MKKRTNKTTGYEWDGIRELNNPIPVLWSIAFVFLIILSFFLWFLIPSWPSLKGYFKGFADLKQVESDEILLKIENQDYAEALEEASFDEILSKENLKNFAVALGKSSFLINCSSCHVLNGSGNKNFPALNDKDWVWGGSLEDIYATIKYGVRNSYLDSRQGEMQGFVETEVLTEDEGRLVGDYVRGFSSQLVDLSQEQMSTAADLFAKNCASCHGKDGLGDTSSGAPNLTDDIWLYGGSEKDIYHSIAYGRAGVMPGWYEKLQDPVIKATAVYVYSLSEDDEKEVFPEK